MARKDPVPKDGRTDGANVAAYLSAAFAVFVLGLVQVAAELRVAFKEWVQELGNTFLGEARGLAVGPYSGKEILTLAAWALAWAALHGALRGRRFDVRSSFAVAMILLGLGVVMLWPPVWHFLKDVA